MYVSNVFVDVVMDFLLYGVLLLFPVFGFDTIAFERVVWVCLLYFIMDGFVRYRESSCLEVWGIRYIVWG